MISLKFKEKRIVVEEIVIGTVVQGENSIGCKRFKKDVMISFTFESEEVEFGDFFMKKETALKLQEQLNKALDIKEQITALMCTVDGEGDFNEDCVLDEDSDYTRGDCDHCSNNFEIKKREDCKHWNKVVKYK